MKHLWLGAGLLILLLAVSLWLGAQLEDVHQPAAQDLKKAAGAALEENWDRADIFCTRAQQHWQSHRNLTAALIHHDRVSQIDGYFASLTGYLRCRDTASFYATCMQLAQALHALPQSHQFSWWNLL